jgi:hypothetical protein
MAPQRRAVERVAEKRRSRMKGRMNLTSTSVQLILKKTINGSLNMQYLK